MIRPSVSLIVVTLLFLVEARKEKCEKCLPINSCSFYGNLNREEQERWAERFECPKSDKHDTGPLFGFSQTAKGDMVCCPNSIWGTDKNDAQGTKEQNINKNAQYNVQSDFKPPNQRDNALNYNKPADNDNSNRPTDILSSYDTGSNRPADNNYEPSYETHRAPQNHQVRQPYNQGNWAPRPANNDWNRNNQNFGRNRNPFDGNGNSVSGNQNPLGRQGNAFGNANNFGQNGNNFGSNDNSFGRNDNSFGRNENFFGGNGNAFGRNGNAFGKNGNAFGRNGNAFGRNGNSFGRNQNTPGGNSFGGSNSGNQCPVTSYPPNPESGCCGREATDSDRIIVRQPWASRNEGPRMDRPWKSPMDDYRNWNSQMRFKRQATNVTVDHRIAGGKETELEQFPWTVLLKTTFDYGSSEASFNCGGSLISSFYVLTAGHCVVDDNARVKDIEIYLAEFDKRTFPRDCKNILGEGQKCVENIVIRAENFFPHPNYDNDRLFNDIALIKLQRPAPYTDYIRPICLPPINVDEPDFFNLRLAVSGWGRNGKYKSDIKQSTVVNLVPNRECRNYYPNLSNTQLCAAGYSGEDTCKGDSGGPLMLQYEGKYFVSGVVSGKRADAPCGTSVPSLYTNVYQHLDWIRNNIRN
ncbi:uncharacterized protein LOC106141535 [Amyelois transitella]|uniref:uncharacterized protein LOC106141535 n=1 Tax=Amyelois transitella TaxID=680683 RepID=UPI00067C8F52|nr:uncharacterized protein LOC106141535 [Amyelois transitella]